MPRPDARTALYKNANTAGPGLYFRASIAQIWRTFERSWPEQTISEALFCPVFAFGPRKTQILPRKLREIRSAGGDNDRILY